MFLSQICRLSRHTAAEIPRNFLARCGFSKSLSLCWAHGDLTAPCSFLTPLCLRDLRAQSDHAKNCRISIHSKPARDIHLSSISPWEGGEGCCWVQLHLLNARKVGTEIYPPDWCMRSSCLEHHEVLGRRCFFCLGKGTFIFLSDS